MANSLGLLPATECASLQALLLSAPQCCPARRYLHSEKEIVRASFILLHIQRADRMYRNVYLNPWVLIAKPWHRSHCRASGVPNLCPASFVHLCRELWENLHIF